MSCCTSANGATCAAFTTVLRRHLRAEADDGGWDQTKLVELGLDSMSAVDLVLDIEASFGVVFPDEVLVAETFDTASSLHAVVISLASPA